MVEVDGAVQVSKPRPLPTSEVSEADEEDEVAAAEEVAAVADAAERAGVFCLPEAALTVIAEPAAAAADGDEPEPDRWELVWATTFAPARIERSPASFGPYVAVTSTPALGTSTWNR